MSRRRQRADFEIIPTETSTHRAFTKKKLTIIPRNRHQEEYLHYLMDPQKLIVLAHGPAGTGKTILAMMAGIKALQDKQVSKLILTRPVISVTGEEALGALPGDLNQKMDPYTRPLFDVLYQYYSNKDIQLMLEDRIIEVSPLSFMRGRNFENCFIILDEAQNTTVPQMKMLLTRISHGTKVIITGDNAQSDRKDSNNGLLHFKNLLAGYGRSNHISAVEFAHRDIERHPIVAEILDIYGET